MAISAFGVDHGGISKADSDTRRRVVGNTVAAGAAGGAAVAGTKAVKLSQAANRGLQVAADYHTATHAGVREHILRTHPNPSLRSLQQDVPKVMGKLRRVGDRHSERAFRLGMRSAKSGAVGAGLAAGAVGAAIYGNRRKKT